MLDELTVRIGGTRCLEDCTGRDSWPERGVYFFFEPGEQSSQSGNGLRVVRVGTHCISKKGSKTTLWKRLSQHKGTSTGEGNHRRSIFRHWVGDALACRDTGLCIDTWADRNASGRLAKENERNLERRVSEYIRNMPFLWLDVDDASGTSSMRAFIERNAISLLSNFGNTSPIDPPSAEWLGRYSSSNEIRSSGLWNSNHVSGIYDPLFLQALSSYIRRVPAHPTLLHRQ
jgi:hypothetical protein